MQLQYFYTHGDMAMLMKMEIFFCDTKNILAIFVLKKHFAIKSTSAVTAYFFNLLRYVSKIMVYLFFLQLNLNVYACCGHPKNGNFFCTQKGH